MNAVLQSFLHAGQHSEFWAALVVGSMLHEMGHVFTALAMGIRVKRLGISPMGPYVVRAEGTPIENIWIALSGPAVNLGLAVVMFFGMPIFGLVNLALVFINLIPVVRSSDGFKVVCNLKRVMLWGETE
jgi:Zn-dependent protease